MDLLPLHPKIVHLPIALAVIMPLLTAGLLAAWRFDALPRRTWCIAVLLQVLLFGSGIASLRTGGAEEERVERLVGEVPMRAHEEAAERFVWATGVVLLLIVGAATTRNERVAHGIALAASVATLVVLLLGYCTGEAGGRLVYEHGAANAYVANRASAAPPGPFGAESTRPRRDD